MCRPRGHLSADTCRIDIRVDLLFRKECVVLKAVLLAAGDGGRLRPLSLETPKVLLEVPGGR